MRNNIASFEQLTNTSRATTRAIALLVSVRDELELAGRAPGERVTITRQTWDRTLNDMAIVGKLIREMAEGGHE